MTEKKPAVDGLSMRMRGKSYIRSETVNKAAPTSMKVRGKSYVGLPLSDQSDAHKGGHLPRRGAGYTGVKQNDSGTPSALHPYATNSEFRLKIGKYSLKCAKISNLTIAAETEEVPEGGNNLFPNVFLGARKKADTLVVERALVDDDILSVFKVGVHVGECTLTILRNGEVYKELGFDDGIVTKFELTNLDAMGREIMIHKLEIAHSGLYTW